MNCFVSKRDRIAIEKYFIRSHWKLRQTFLHNKEILGPSHKRLGSKSTKQTSIRRSTMSAVLLTGSFSLLSEEKAHRNWQIQSHICIYWITICPIISHEHKFYYYYIVKNIICSFCEFIFTQHFCKHFIDSMGAIQTILGPILKGNIIKNKYL